MPIPERNECFGRGKRARSSVGCAALLLPRSGPSHDIKVEPLPASLPSVSSTTPSSGSSARSRPSLKMLCSLLQLLIVAGDLDETVACCFGKPCFARRNLFQGLCHQEPKTLCTGSPPALLKSQYTLATFSGRHNSPLRQNLISALDSALPFVS